MTEHDVLVIDTDAELEKIMRRLDTLPEQLKAPDVLKRALNTTARKVRRQLAKDAVERYTLEQKNAFTKESKVLSANTSTLTATVLAKGPMRDIMDFMTQPNTATGAAAAKILNSASMKPLEVSTVSGTLKAFVTRFQSGHTAIVQRRGAARLPVKKLLSPAVPHMMGNEEVRERAEALAYEELVKQIDRQIERLTGAQA